jgi:hypothetical protein
LPPLPIASLQKRVAQRRRESLERPLLQRVLIEQAWRKMMDNVAREHGAFAGLGFPLMKSIQETRIAKGYSLDDLAIATGLTIEEIVKAEANEDDAPVNHLERIRIVLR